MFSFYFLENCVERKWTMENSTGIIVVMASAGWSRTPATKHEQWMNHCQCLPNYCFSEKFLKGGKSSKNQLDVIAYANVSAAQLEKLPNVTCCLEQANLVAVTNSGVVESKRFMVTHGKSSRIVHLGHTLAGLTCAEDVRTSILSDMRSMALLE